MRVLIACEYSGTVRDAFLRKGHEVLSCDLLPTDAPGPHYTGSVFDVIDYPWDFGGFHFPCTDGSVSGARHFAAKKMDGRFYASASLWMQRCRKQAEFRDIEADLKAWRELRAQEASALMRSTSATAIRSSGREKG